MTTHFDRASKKYELNYVCQIGTIKVEYFMFWFTVLSRNRNEILKFKFPEYPGIQSLTESLKVYGLTGCMDLIFMWLIIIFNF
jgi:hypothetical protein